MDPRHAPTPRPRPGVSEGGGEEGNIFKEERKQKLFVRDYNEKGRRSGRGRDEVDKARKKERLDKKENFDRKRIKAIVAFFFFFSVTFTFYSVK